MKTLSTLASLALVVLALSGCNTVDPCTKLAAPTPQELAAVQSGAQVERDANATIECDLINGRWIREHD